jgi:DNA-binding beta-propeller fold protein YncE
MPRSLGSVYGGSVTQFLRGSLYSTATFTIEMPGVKSWGKGIAVSRDGTRRYVSDRGGQSHGLREYSLVDGSLLWVIGKKAYWLLSFHCNGPLEFQCPCQVWVAPDDFVFVADCGNHRVHWQVLTPTLNFHGFVGVGTLTQPTGVCADDDVVVVSEWLHNGATTASACSGAAMAPFFVASEASLVDATRCQRTVGTSCTTDRAASVFCPDMEAVAAPTTSPSPTSTATA